MALAAEERRNFFDRFLGSADSRSGVDEMRRGAPPPQLAASAEMLRLGTPLANAAAAAVTAADVAAAWRAFLRAHVRDWAPPPAAGPIDENKHVHPSVFRILGAVSPLSLRIWRARTLEDIVAEAFVAPDFLLAAARDASPALLGALLVVEVKLPGALAAAESQARIHLRRLLYKRCCERDACGERFDGVSAFAAATDGSLVSLIHMRSGAPAPGGSFSAATPCPVTVSEALPLLGNWDFRLSPASFQAAAEPPAGFSMLARICAAAAVLGVDELQDVLHADVHWAAARDGGGGGGGGAAQTCDFVLGNRLGRGGVSDVYSCTAGAAAAAHADLFVKVSRYTSRLVCANFAAEAEVLDDLHIAAERGLVPALIGSGFRAHASARAAARTLAWPLLVLRPRGVPLEAWVSSRVAEAVAAAGAGDAAAAADRARRESADAVLLRLLDALEAAHAAGWVHCDVRPPNVAVVDGCAMLVDWGSAARRSTPARGRGVPAFADERSFSQWSFAARPSQDALGALLLWLAVSHGAACAAPWLDAAGAGVDDAAVFFARATWVDQRVRAGGDAAVCLVAAATQILARATPAAAGVLAIAREAIRGRA